MTSHEKYNYFFEFYYQKVLPTFAICKCLYATFVHDTLMYNTNYMHSYMHSLKFEPKT